MLYALLCFPKRCSVCWSAALETTSVLICGLSVAWWGCKGWALQLVPLSPGTTIISPQLKSSTCLSCRRIFELAIEACGLHCGKGSLVWDAYREMEAAMLSLTPEGSEEQVKAKERLNKLWIRQLRQPLVRQTALIILFSSHPCLHAAGNGGQYGRVQAMAWERG